MTTRYVVTSFALALCSLFLARVDSAQATDAIDLMFPIALRFARASTKPPDLVFASAATP